MHCRSGVNGFADEKLECVLTFSKLVFPLLPRLSFASSSSRLAVCLSYVSTEALQMYNQRSGLQTERKASKFYHNSSYSNHTTTKYTRCTMLCCQNTEQTHHAIRAIEQSIAAQTLLDGEACTG